MDLPHTPSRLPARAACVAAGLVVLAGLAACNDAEQAIPTVPSESSSTGTSTQTGGTSTSTTTSTGTATLPASVTPTDTPTSTTTAVASATEEEQLRHLVLSILGTGGTTAEQAALDDLDVVAIPVPGRDTDLWVAVTSGSGIYDLPSADGQHVLAVYEHRSDGTWVEMAVMPLASEPTYAEVGLIPGMPTDEPGLWIAVSGTTGAHSGTFELVEFDGVTLQSAFWWFSPSPGAAVLDDLDGDGIAEIILDATDPYIYCYACGVRAWDEIIYRWEAGDPVAVPLAPVESDNQRVYDLTEQAVLLAESNLWRRAAAAMQLAAEAAPEDEDLRWLKISIDRTAAMRLEHAGSEGQPLVTNVLAGEFDAAVDLMAAYDPAEVFDAAGPLFAGTSADGAGEATSAYLVDYASTALNMDATLAAAYAVRALGHAIGPAPDWSAALLDMDAALAIEPSNPFYRAADEYLLEQAGGVRG